MAVPVDHGSESGGPRLEIELRNIVQQVNRDPSDLEHLGLRQPARPDCLVDVSADCSHGCDGCKLVENFGIADVARVNDALRPAQCIERFRPQQAVGVGDNADEDGVLSSQFSDSGLSSSARSSPHEMARLPCWCRYRAFLFPPPAAAAGPSSPASALTQG